MHGANLDPGAYGITDDGVKASAPTKIIRQELSVPQKAANWLYLNPFKMIGKSPIFTYSTTSFCLLQQSR